MQQSIDFDQFNWFRPVNWRFERVLEMVDRSPHPGRATRRDDPYIRGMRNFLLRYRAHTDNASERNRLSYEAFGPFMAYQFDMHREETGLGKNGVATMEARILAGMTDEQIAPEFFTKFEVVEWYEAIFFNVRDRLKSHDWVLNKVLMPAMEKHFAQPVPEGQAVRFGIPFFDPTVKFFAYFGGPVALDYVLSGFRRGVKPTNGDEISSWMTKYTNDRHKHRMGAAISTCNVTGYNLTEMMNVYCRILEIERSGESSETKKDQIHKCISSMLTEMPWGVGDVGAKNIRGTAVEKYDSGAGELRDSELLLLSAGENPGTIEGVEMMTMPPPRRRAGQEDQKHAPNTQ